MSVVVGPHMKRYRNKWQTTAGESQLGYAVSRESGEEDLGAAGFLRSAYSAGPVSQTCFT